MQREQLRRLLEERTQNAAVAREQAAAEDAVTASRPIPESAYRFDRFPQYYQLHLHKTLSERAGIRNPYFQLHEGVARASSVIAGQTRLSYGTYNYLGLNGDPRLVEAMAEAASQYGISAGASRLVAGERPPHRALEQALAALHGVDEAVVFVSGHATNVSTIATLMGPRDLILHDRLVHNSAVQGALLSGAQRQAFPHNDWQALDAILAERRHQFEKVLIVVEGLYSMDGDLCPLDRLIEVKRRHKALLMVDEAHSMGVLGATGRGVAEHFGLPGSDVDIWMGTLSKSFAACGGYIAGSTALIEILKFTAPGFVYSVGMPPPIAAVATRAVALMLAEPERIGRLRANARLFLALARERGLDTGLSGGYSIVPIITGRSVLAVKLSNALADRGIDAPPIIYPAVEEQAARLRFFLTADHTEAQIRQTIGILSVELARLLAELEAAD